MTATHEASAAREPINVAEKSQQLRLRDFRDDSIHCEYRFNISFFRKD